MASEREEDLFTSALALPATERARLAHALLRSLEQGEDPDAANHWLSEIERRAREVKTGTVELEEWSAVKAELARRWAKPRE